MAIQFEGMWEALGKPTTFHVIEMGSGNGTLARDVISHVTRTKGDFSRALRYVEFDRYGYAIGMGASIKSPHNLLIKG